MDQSIDGLARVEPGAGLQGCSETAAEELSVNLLLRSCKKPNRDQGVGMVESDPERVASGVQHCDHVTGPGGSPGFPDLVAEDPRMPAAYSPVLLSPKDNLLFTNGGCH